MGTGAPGDVDPQTILYVAYGIMALSLVAFLIFRVRGLKRSRRLKLERLWVIPAIYALFAVGLFWRQPPHGLQWLWALGAALLGGGFGWLRGRAGAKRTEEHMEERPAYRDYQQRVSFFLPRPPREG